MPRTEHASNVPMPFGMSIFCVDATDCSANFYSGVEDVTVVTIDEEKKVVGGGEKIKCDVIMSILRTVVSINEVQRATDPPR